MIPRAFWHYLAALYFAFQSLVAALWWLIVFVEPRVRRHYFQPTGTPDSAFFAFVLPDAVLFIGAALWASFRLVKKPESARIPLAVHLSAALYAALYCLSQTLLTNEAMLATILMSSSVVCGAFFSWRAAFSGD